MIKKILITSIILAASSNIVIAGTPYVGGSLGVTNLGVSGGNVQAGAIGKLFGGYGSIFGVNENIYLGAELNLDIAHYPYDSGTTYGLGASFIPGVMLTDCTMLYGRVGIEANRNMHSSTIYAGNQLGFGLQTRLSQNWEIRPEYVHVTNIHGDKSGDSQLNLGLVYKLD